MDNKNESRWTCLCCFKKYRELLGSYMLYIVYWRVPTSFCWWFCTFYHGKSLWQNHHLGEYFSFSKHLEQIPVFIHPGASIDTKSSRQTYFFNFADRFQSNQGLFFILKIFPFQKGIPVCLLLGYRSTLDVAGNFFHCLSSMNSDFSVRKSPIPVKPANKVPVPEKFGTWYPPE